MKLKSFESIAAVAGILGISLVLLVARASDPDPVSIKGSQGIVINDTTQLQPISNGTNIAVDFKVPVSIFKPTNNVFLIFSTNFSSAGSQDKLFKLKGSASNFTVKFGTDFTNLYGVYTTNGYILGNSNGPHMLAIHIDAAHGTETAAIIPPNN